MSDYSDTQTFRDKVLNRAISGITNFTHQDININTISTPLGTTWNIKLESYNNPVIYKPYAGNYSPDTSLKLPTSNSEHAYNNNMDKLKSDVLSKKNFNGPSTDVFTFNKKNDDITCNITLNENNLFNYLYYIYNHVSNLNQYPLLKRIGEVITKLICEDQKPSGTFEKMGWTIGKSIQGQQTKDRKHLSDVANDLFRKALTGKSINDTEFLDLFGNSTHLYTYSINTFLLDAIFSDMNKIFTLPSSDSKEYVNLFGIDRNNKPKLLEYSPDDKFKFIPTRVFPKDKSKTKTMNPMNSPFIHVITDANGKLTPTTNTSTDALLNTSINSIVTLCTNSTVVDQTLNKCSSPNINVKYNGSFFNLYTLPSTLTNVLSVKSADWDAMKNKFSIQLIRTVEYTFNPCKITNRSEIHDSHRLSYAYPREWSKGPGGYHLKEYNNNYNIKYYAYALKIRNDNTNQTWYVDCDIGSSFNVGLASNVYYYEKDHSVYDKGWWNTKSDRYYYGHIWGANDIRADDKNNEGAQASFGTQYFFATEDRHGNYPRACKVRSLDTHSFNEMDQNLVSWSNNANGFLYREFENKFGTRHRKKDVYWLSSRDVRGKNDSDIWDSGSHMSGNVTFKFTLKVRNNYINQLNKILNTDNYSSNYGGFVWRYNSKKPTRQLYPDWNTRDDAVKTYYNDETYEANFDSINAELRSMEFYAYPSVAQRVFKDMFGNDIKSARDYPNGNVNAFENGIGAETSYSRAVYCNPKYNVSVIDGRHHYELFATLNKNLTRLKNEFVKEVQTIVYNNPVMLIPCRFENGYGQYLLSKYKNGYVNVACPVGPIIVRRNESLYGPARMIVSDGFEFSNNSVKYVDTSLGRVVTKIVLHDTVNNNFIDGFYKKVLEGFGNCNSAVPILYFDISQSLGNYLNGTGNPIQVMQAPISNPQSVTSKPGLYIMFRPKSIEMNSTVLSNSVLLNTIKKPTIVYKNFKYNYCNDDIEIRYYTMDKEKGVVKGIGNFAISKTVLTLLTSNFTDSNYKEDVDRSLRCKWDLMK